LRQGQKTIGGTQHFSCCDIIGIMKSKTNNRSKGPKNAKYAADNVPIPRNIKQSILRDVSQIISPVGITKAAADAGGASYFLFGNLADWPQWGIFDQYKIDSVEIEFQLTQSGGNMLYPTLLWTPDYDDANVPTLAGIQAFEHCEMFVFSEFQNVFRRKIRPKIAQTAYQAGVASGYVLPAASTWINGDYPNVQHFGHKWFILNYNTTSANLSNINIAYRYHVSFKTVK
jgi:hypothetical protein